MISSATGIDFSDLQGGKCEADRHAATCKNHVRTFINKGNNMMTDGQLKTALLLHGGKGVQVAVMQSIDEEAVVDKNRKSLRINK